MSAFPVRCRRVPGLGMTIMPSSGGGGRTTAVIYGGTTDMSSRPGYVGNNPQVITGVASGFQMFQAANRNDPLVQNQGIVPGGSTGYQAPVQRQPPPPPPPPPIIIPRRTEDVYRYDPPPVQPPPVVVQPPPVVRPPPVVQPPSEVTPNIAQKPAAEAPKKSDATAAVVGISAAGLLAALLFR
jgi:hypothetical protein